MNTEETIRLSRERRPSQVLIGSVQKNLLQTVKVHVIPGRHPDVDVRIFETDAVEAEHVTTAGFRLDAQLIPELIGLLERAQEYARPGVLIVQDQEVSR